MAHGSSRTDLRPSDLCGASSAETTGIEKANDFPEPVPVAITT